MPTYSVLVPFTGSMLVEVEADNPEAAEETAFEVEFDVHSVHELEFHNKDGTILLSVNKEDALLIRDAINQLYPPS